MLMVSKKAKEKVTKKEKGKKTEIAVVKKEDKEKKSRMSMVVTVEMPKQDLIQLFATKDGDTGSPEVQVALATHKILNLTKHLEQNPKDNHSRRGLLKVISKRRRILNYVQEKDGPRYEELVKKLGLNK